MSELTVPTVALDADVTCADGRRFRGCLFVPATAPTHAGPTRAEDWMNALVPFFPFASKEGGPPVLLNKREVLFVTVAAEADAGDLPEGTASPSRRVAVEAESQRLEGTIVVDMPQDRTRVLDYLNGSIVKLTLSPC